MSVKVWPSPYSRSAVATSLSVQGVTVVCMIDYPAPPRHLSIAVDTNRGVISVSKIEEQTPARFPPGTFAKIADVLDDGVARSDFFREATEREIMRRTMRNFRRQKRKVLYERQPRQPR
jgi:hypothetical protein